MVRARRATASSRCRTAQIISRSRAERPFFIFVVGKVPRDGRISSGSCACYLVSLFSAESWWRGA
jgi:hypothetical protein